MPTTATATSAQTARQRDSTEMRGAVPEERRRGRGREHPASTRHNDTNNSSSAGTAREGKTGRDGAKQSERPEIVKGN